MSANLFKYFKIMTPDDDPDNNNLVESISSMDAYVNQASDINGQLILLILIAATMGLGKGGVPGFATIATALTVSTAPISITGGLGYAVALQVPILTMIDVSAAWLHKDKLDWPTVWLLLPLSFAGMAIGQILDRYMTDSAARILVGSILLSILFMRIWKDCVAAVLGKDHRFIRNSNKLDHKNSSESLPYSASPPPSQSFNNMSLVTFGWASVVGLIGGAATMLTNSMGPILNVYLLSVRQLSPAAYIGTRAMFFCFINLGKLPMRFMSGTLGWPMIPLAAGLGLVSVLGVFCAKPIMMSMSERTFVRLELSVVAFAGVRLMWTGLHATQGAPARVV